ncbi:hypothetical protein ILUMI_21031 [Ignelater luminosus]|uniref:F-box domain-containing protein n=1 Tax=Ignelater luminosus TaxID=2038154 RepID=A0A8K0CD01_IGNLU|nr:hypothetical protein ILUMI_21031 [Ignelater luminosus]
MEPMMLEDYKEDNIPRSLQNLFNYFKQEDVTLDKNDLAVIFIYILMLESGFVTPDFLPLHEESAQTCDFHYKRLLLLTERMPKDWKRSKTSYRLSFVLIPCPINICSVTCILVSDELVVNCCVNNVNSSENHFSILLDPSLYIVNYGNYGIKRIFQNLKDLSLKFKNLISHPCKMLILQTGSLRAATLMSLPPELLNYILKYCDRQTRNRFQKMLKQPNK